LECRVWKVDLFQVEVWPDVIALCWDGRGAEKVERDAKRGKRREKERNGETGKREEVG
jgi:hypothetical protein